MKVKLELVAETVEDECKIEYALRAQDLVHCLREIEGDLSLGLTEESKKMHSRCLSIIKKMGLYGILS